MGPGDFEGTLGVDDDFAVESGVVVVIIAEVEAEDVGGIRLVEEFFLHLGDGMVVYDSEADGGADAGGLFDDMVCGLAQLLCVDF